MKGYEETEPWELRVGRTKLVDLHEPPVYYLNHIHFAVENATLTKGCQSSQGGKIVPNEELVTHLLPGGGAMADGIQDYPHGVICLGREDGRIKMKSLSILPNKIPHFRVRALKEQHIAKSGAVQRAPSPLEQIGMVPGIAAQ